MMCGVKYPRKVKIFVTLVTSATNLADRKGRRDRKKPRHGLSRHDRRRRGDRRCEFSCTRWLHRAADTRPGKRPDPATRLIDRMHRHLRATLSAATVVVAVGIPGCSSHQQPRIASSAPAAAPATSSTVVVSPTTPLPPPEALTDILARLADPNVPGINKVSLVEGATPESAASLDKFSNALRDNGYLPMNFVAHDIAWSDKTPSDVVATIDVNTAQPANGSFHSPMEFTPFQGGWQLSRRTAEMLLTLGSSPAVPPPNPPPAPEPAPAPAPAPATSPPG